MFICSLYNYMFNQFEWSKFNKNALVGLTNLEKVCLFQANPTFVENWKFNHNLLLYFKIIDSNFRLPPHWTPLICNWNLICNCVCALPGEQEVDEGGCDGGLLEGRPAQVRLHRRHAAARLLVEDALAQQLEQKEVDVLGVGVLLLADQAEQPLHVQRRLQQPLQLRVLVRRVLPDVFACGRTKREKRVLVNSKVCK